MVNNWLIRAAAIHDGAGSSSLPCRDPGPRPELRIWNAAAQTRMVSVARIRLDFWKSVRRLKWILPDDISEFESDMPSHAVGLPVRSIQWRQAIKRLIKPPPAHAVLDHYAWRYHCRGLFQMPIAA
jgi:hypothetical protein